MNALEPPLETRCSTSPVRRRLFALATLCAALFLALSTAHGQVFVREWGSQGSGPGQFDQPFDIGVDHAGNVYVLDLVNRRVQKFDTNGAFLLEFGSFGSEPGQWNDAYGISVQPDGHVWVADARLNRLTLFDDQGHFVRMIQSPSLYEGGVLESPTDIDVDESGRLWVTEWGTTRVAVLTSDGAAFDSWPVPFEFHVTLALDPNDAVYVAGRPGLSATRFSRSGVSLHEFWFFGGPVNWLRPNGLASDAAGHLYVTRSWQTPRITKYSPDGIMLADWGNAGVGPGQFTTPWGVAVDAEDNVYVTDRDTNRVLKFAPLPVPAIPTTWGRLKSLYR